MGGGPTSRHVARMARMRSPLLVVVENGKVRGLLTASHLLEVLLPAEDGESGPQPATTSP